jgi:hypothetical protein
MRVETIVGEVKMTASLIGLQFEVVNASTSREIDAAFATLAAAPRVVKSKTKEMM